NVGRPLFTQWIRWSGLQVPHSGSLPWILLTMVAVLQLLRDMARHRRSDAVMYMAVLLVVASVVGSSAVGLTLVALSAPLIIRSLVKKEFLFHRGVRRSAIAALLLTLLLSGLLHDMNWLVTGVAMLLGLMGSLWFYSALPWWLA